MEEHFIQLKKSNILKIGLRDYEGNDIGEHWEFDMEDVELPLKLNMLLEEHKKNERNFKNQVIIINKRQDQKGRKLLSKNEEDKIKAWNDYVNKEIEVYNIFLGENGVQKFLNGRKPYYTMFNEIDEAIESIMPLIEKNSVDITEKIKSKYSSKKDDVLE